MARNAPGSRAAALFGIDGSEAMLYLGKVTRALPAVALLTLRAAAGGAVMGGAVMGGAVMGGAVMGCASDPDPAPPEPTLTTPGAFFARPDDDGALGLFRTLSSLEIELDTILFCSTYHATPRSFEEASAFARDHELPVALELTFVSRSSVLSSEHEVVWFRSLTDEELARVP